MNPTNSQQLSTSDTLRHALSVDVEEYFHATNLESVAPPARWHAMPKRVEYCTRKVLDVLARHNVRATFFVLGYCARRFPGMVRDIVKDGHELASHGYSHRLVYTQTPRAFYRDVYRTKRLLEDISGEAVWGYRAPSFSIRENNLWAYDVLVEAGYRYDSSLYPAPHPRYGNPHRKRSPEILHRNKGDLIVFPLAVRALRIFGKDLCLGVAGGAYWRILPRWYIAWNLRNIVQDEQLWFTCYFHPWELDAEQPVAGGLPFLTKVRHYGGLSQFEKKIDYFLSRFSFVSLREAARQTLGKQAEALFLPLVR